MKTKEIRGEELAVQVRAEIRSAFLDFRARGISPKMSVFMLGENSAAKSYLLSKQRLALEFGVDFDLVALAEDTNEGRLREEVSLRARDPKVHGIVLEMPLPEAMNAGGVLDMIPREKDIDGLTAVNLGLIYSRREEEAILPATPQACILLAESIGSLHGIRVAMVGKGRTVGSPLIGMLLNRGATLTVCHSRTPDLADPLKDCDIIFSGVGRPGLLSRKNIREGQIVIDAGLSFADGKIKGDLDPDSAQGFLKAFTPVPGGVGPLTSLMIFKNLEKAIRIQAGLES